MLAIYEEKRSGYSKRRKLTVGFGVVGVLCSGVIAQDWSAVLLCGIVSAYVGWAYGTDEIKRREKIRTLGRE